MQIQNFIVLILFLVSARAFAIGNVQTFPTKNECLNSFITLTGNKDAVAGENYCKDKVVKSTIDICAETKLLDYKKANSISATEELRFLQKFKNECLQAALQSQQNLNQQVQLQSQQNQQAILNQQAAAQQSGQTAPQGGQSNAAAAASLARSLAPAIRDYIKESDAKPAEKPTVKPVASSGDNETAANAGSTSAPTNTSDYSTIDINSQAFLNSPVLAPKEATTVAKTEEKPETNTAMDEFTRVDANYTPEKQAADQKRVNATAEDAKTAAPNLAPAITSTAQAASGGPPAPASAITQASTATSGTLTKGVEAIVSPVSVQLKEAEISLPFTNTLAAFRATTIDLDKYVSATKPACTAQANTTEYLCMNGPGAKATKKLMTAAGPILSAFGSAQKTCSATAKVSALASAALTLATGVCVGAKFYCDSLCATAVADLNKTTTALLGLIQTAYAKDYKAATAACETQFELCVAEGFGYTATLCEGKQTTCINAAAAKVQAASVAAEKLVALLQQENAVATPGTSAALVAGCAAKAADIALLVGDIAGTAVAAKNAFKCEKDLAADGGSGKTVAQYCDTNAETQFCKCQQNAQQEGCPGYVASANKTDKPAEVAGLFLQNNGGLNGFAGSGPKGGRLDLSKTTSGDKVNLNDPSADTNSLSSPDGSPSSPSGAIGGSPGSRGARGSGSDANTKDDQAAKKKEWSFGAFASKLGGMFGGAKSSKASSGNGALNAKQEAAIKRKLASDKLASEITSASGKSNWEKVRQAYLIKETSLLGQ